MSDPRIKSRKNDHLRIVLDEQVLHRQSTLLDEIHLHHEAIPEMDLSEIDVSRLFFGKRLEAPLMITSMSGGADQARRLNHVLATVAARHGIAFAVGSQRVMLHYPESAVDFDVRECIPDGVLLGNIGAVQLRDYTPREIAGLVERIQADGISVHLNNAQELMQQEGDRRFRGVMDGLARLMDELDGRLLVKETGAGLSPSTLEKLAAIGVPYVDISGAGGTSWTKVEMHRFDDGPKRQVAETFSEWGIPTAFCIEAARRLCRKETCIIGAGGITNGLDAARAIAAGADIAGFARAALMAFDAGGVEGASEFVGRIIGELRNAMLLTGARDVERLKTVPRQYSGMLRQWLKDHHWLDRKRTTSAKEPALDTNRS